MKRMVDVKINPLTNIVEVNPNNSVYEYVIEKIQ